MNVTRLPVPERPAPYGTTPPASFDASRPAPHTAALKAAWNDGQHYGERIGYVSGWRLGFVTGLVLMLLLAMGAVSSAKHLGWL